MQDRIVEIRVRSMSMCFPTSIGQVELDGPADRLVIINTDDRIGEIRTCGPIPSAKLDNINLIAGNRLESFAEIASEPACLKF
jgi:hypothetical protein